jgi:hypothetical protein
MFDYSGWTYTITVKTQAILPVQTNLRGKIFISIYGEQASIVDAVLASIKSIQEAFHPGGEDLIDLQSRQRLGEVTSSIDNIDHKTIFTYIRYIRLNYDWTSPNGNHGCAKVSRSLIGLHRGISRHVR